MNSWICQRWESIHLLRLIGEWLQTKFLIILLVCQYYFRPRLVLLFWPRWCGLVAALNKAFKSVFRLSSLRNRESIDIYLVHQDVVLPRSKPPIICIMHVLSYYDVNKLKTPYASLRLLSGIHWIQRTLIKLNSFIAIAISTGACKYTRRKITWKKRTFSMRFMEYTLLSASYEYNNIRHIGAHHF